MKTRISCGIVLVVMAAGIGTFIARPGAAVAKPVVTIYSDATVGAGGSLALAFDATKYKAVGQPRLRLKEEDAPIDEHQWIDCNAIPNCGAGHASVTFDQTFGSGSARGGLLSDKKTWMVAAKLTPTGSQGQHWRARIELDIVQK